MSTPAPVKLMVPAAVTVELVSSVMPSAPKLNVAPAPALKLPWLSPLLIRFTVPLCTSRLPLLLTWACRVLVPLPALFFSIPVFQKHLLLAADRMERGLQSYRQAALRAPAAKQKPACREVLLAVPNTQREAALALGATRWETIRLAVLRYGKSGLMGAILLGLGRAIGETMAVTMVIGNTPQISLSLLSPAYTMPSVIANEFAETTTKLHGSALMEIGLILLVVTLIINVLARLLVWSVSRGQSRGGMIQ